LRFEAGDVAAGHAGLGRDVGERQPLRFHSTCEARHGDIDKQKFAEKQTDLRDRMASIKLELDVVDRSHDDMAEFAVKAFELSQTAY
jgi:hypothetical protein